MIVPARLLVTWLATFCAVALAPAAAEADQAGSPTSLTSPSESAGAFTATTQLSRSDGWAVGYLPSGDGTATPLAQHWDGSAWQQSAVPLPAGRSHAILTGVTAVSTSNLWAVGSSVSDSDGSTATLTEHWNGRRWKVVPSADPEGSHYSVLEGVTALTARNIWAVGYTLTPDGNGYSIIEHWDGTSWSIVGNADPDSAYKASLQAVTAVSARNVWATGYYYDQTGAGVTQAQHWNGRRWKLVETPSIAGSPDAEFHAVSAASGDDIWATGFYTITGSTFLPLTEHWNGTSWSVVDAAVPDDSANTYLYGVTADSTYGAWAVGYYYAPSIGAYRTLIERWNGTRWRLVDSPNPTDSSLSYLLGLDATSRSDAWAVGYSYANGDTPIAEHWNGRRWKLVPTA